MTVDSLAEECFRLSQARGGNLAVTLEYSHGSWAAMAPGDVARKRDRHCVGRGKDAESALRQLAATLRARPEIER